MTISLAISVNYAAAESEGTEYNFTVLTGDELINNPLASQILQNIELAKQRLAEQQEKQRLAEEYQIFLDEQRSIVQQLLQNDLDRMNNDYAEFTPKASFESFLTGIDSTVHDIFWGQFNYQQQKAQAGQEAMKAVLDSGGSLEEARQAYFQKAATTQTEIIEVNKNLNIKYGFADAETQVQFDEFGKLPRSDSESSIINDDNTDEEMVSPEVNTPKIIVHDEPKTKHFDKKCEKWNLKAQKFLNKGKGIPPGIAMKLNACGDTFSDNTANKFMFPPGISKKFSGFF